jgi:signal transduction histidine kinase
MPADMPANEPSGTSFKRLIISALIVPIGMMICISFVLAYQIKGLMDSVGAVERSDAIIAQANRVEKLTIDLETGLRGYLLTGDAGFLDPFNDARAPLPTEAAALADLLVYQPEQRKLLDEINRLRDQWLEFADRTIASRQAGTSRYLDETRARNGKRITDESRRLFRQLLNEAERVRNERSIQSRRDSRNTLIGVGVTTLLGGALLGYLARRQFTELARTYEQALGDARDLNATLENRVADRTRQLEERTGQLVEANRELEAFAYSVSHDLRAPMRHITGFADLVRKSPTARISTDDAENLTTIYDTAKHAGRMVDDLLAFSRIGRAQLRQDDVDMNELLQQVLHDLEPETASRQIEWMISPLPPARGDAALLRMVLHNLVGNAVKYTGKTSHARIEIGATTTTPTTSDTEATARPVDAAVGENVYFVRDNGVGFDMAYADKLFGVFQRLHRAEEFEGTGIGLANVRRIILRHGGRVWADGQLGQGATFTFTIPTASPQR